MNSRALPGPAISFLPSNLCERIYEIEILIAFHPVDAFTVGYPGNALCLWCPPHQYSHTYRRIDRHTNGICIAHGNGYTHPNFDPDPNLDGHTDANLNRDGDPDPYMAAHPWHDLATGDLLC